MSYLLAFIGFALLIILHEAGHFAAAKAVGMRVERFSLFFGSLLVKRQWGETEYGIGWLPLGGYVKISGMSPEEEFDSPELAARGYCNQPVWKRVVVIAAGPGMNIVIAIVLGWLVFSVGHEVLVPKGGLPQSRTVQAVLPHTAAAGVLHAGDRLVSVDGVHGGAKRLHKQILTHTCAHDAHTPGCVATTPAKLVVRRDGRLVPLTVRPRWSAADKEMLVGFEFTLKPLPSGFFYPGGESARWLWHVTTATVTDLVELFKPKERRQLHSIAGAYSVTQQEIARGWVPAFEVLAVISLSLAIINLFPFLPLDGGHIFWALAEKLRGKRIGLVVMERASYVGIALVVLVLFIGLSNDISAFAGGGLHVSQ